MIKIKKMMRRNYMLTNFSKKLLIFILPFVLVTSCAIVNRSHDVEPPASSESFIKAKYLTELVYITRDKDLITSYREDYLKGNINKIKYSAINKWAAGKDRTIVVKSIDLFLNLSFEGV